MTRQITPILAAAAYAALAALLLLASAADAHRNDAPDQYRNQYLQLICEADASAVSMDPDPLSPHVAVGEVCRVATNSVLTPYGADSQYSPHFSNNKSIHSTRAPGAINHTGLPHGNARYRWVIEPVGDSGSCAGDPAATGAKSVPSGNADAYDTAVTSSVTFFAARDSNQTYTVAAEDEGKCIYALVYFDETRQADRSTGNYHHATINPGSNTGGVPTDLTAFNANVIVQAMGTTPPNTVATGAPTVTPAAAEDVELTASDTGITEPDGISTSTLMWQWQSADVPADNANAPADDDYAPIAGQTSSTFSTTFTPGDAESGRYLRVCVSFDDNDGNPEGPLCNAPAAVVINVNDAPMSLTNRIPVSTTATSADPYVFRPSDFPFEDADKDMLAEVSISSLDGPGTMSLNGVAIARATTVTAAQLEAGTLTYYPAPNQLPTKNPDNPMAAYSFFTFKVTDDGSDGASNRISANSSSLNIFLVLPERPSALKLRLRLFLEGPLR